MKSLKASSRMEARRLVTATVARPSPTSACGLKIFRGSSSKLRLCTRVASSSHRLRNSRIRMELPLMRRCPFCHSAPMVIELDQHLWAVACSSCYAIGPHPRAEQDCATAIQLWNEGPSLKIEQQ